VAWIGRRRDNEGSIATVRKMMKKNNILFTRMAKEVSGELFDINIVPKGKAQAMIKSSDPRMTTEKYGGYNKRSRAFFIVVEHRTDKGIVRSFEPVYLMHKAAFENNPTDYCRSILGLTDPRVIRKVKINSLLSLDGFRMHLSGANSETTLGLKDANQLVLEHSMVGYIKKVIKFNGRNREAAKFRKPPEKPERYKITQEKNCEVYDAFVKKLQNPPYNAKQQTPLSWLLKIREKFGQLNTIDQCKALEEILKCFECNAVCGHLKEYGGNDGFGILTLGRNLSTLKNCNFILIDQSVTGFFEKRFDLLNDY
ncbi:MAG: Cas9 endonuclease PAM-interacting domain-containing protein, partial [Eubacteriales bacterium]|nr:Cas9 endonuclease PAM-interacting domain-containing protein [Eubacteriales bacterium]